MRIIERKEVDEKLWTKWCENTADFSPFSRLEYLDSVSDNLLFLVNDTNTGGLALPHVQRMGVKTLYIPVFCRWITWVGNDKPELSTLSKKLFKIFPQAEVYVKNEEFPGKSRKLIYQTLHRENYQLNSQAKRKLKKAEKENWQLEWNQNAEAAISIIELSLKDKFETLEDSSFSKLLDLAKKWRNIEKLKVLNLIHEGKLVGALLLLFDKNRCMYLKGACIEEIKLKGGMYFLMNAAIKSAFEAGCTFDFGGSRISGVRQFNLSFGAQDEIYFHYSWDKGPILYSYLKKMRQKIMK